MKTNDQPKYLLRFDDICPTMRWDIWDEIEAQLLELNIKPIVAIVPDNQDPKLKVDQANPYFWQRARQWQQRGWTIGLHGYQHRYVSANAGLVALRKKSEFAGLSRQEQSEKLRRASGIFAREQLQPRVWIAPGNTFDGTTVSLLPGIGIRVIVDGYFSTPHVSREGITWVPQQLFSFRAVRRGVWTVCYHHNEWTAHDMEIFSRDIRLHHARIQCLEDVLREYEGRCSAWSRRLCTSPRFSRFLVRAQLKVWSWLIPSQEAPVSMTTNAQLG